MTRFAPYVVACSALSLFAMYALSSVAQDAPKGVPPKNEFAGKVVRLYLSDQTLKHVEIALTDAEFVEIGGRLMLVGNGADYDEGLEFFGRIGIAWDNIDMFVVMKVNEFSSLQRERQAKAKQVN